MCANKNFFFFFFFFIFFLFVCTDLKLIIINKVFHDIIRYIKLLFIFTALIVIVFNEQERMKQRPKNANAYKIYNLVRC